MNEARPSSPPPGAVRAYTAPGDRLFYSALGHLLIGNVNALAYGSQAAAGGYQQHTAACDLYTKASQALVDRAEAVGGRVSEASPLAASALSTDCPDCSHAMDLHGLGGCEASVYLNWSDVWGDQATDFCRCTRRGE